MRQSIDRPAPGIALVIPSYRGAGRLETLVPELQRGIAGLAAAGHGLELVVVDDGSPAAELPRLVNALSGLSGCLVRLFHLERNHGQVSATLLGVALAESDIIITMDDDGSHPPDCLLGLLQTLLDNPGLDLVYAAAEPGMNRKRPMLRRLGSLLNKRLFHRHLGLPPRVPVGSFRIFRSTLARQALGRAVSYPYLSALLLAALPLEARQPAHGAASLRAGVGLFRYRLADAGVAGAGRAGAGIVGAGIVGAGRADQGSSRHRLLGLARIYCRLWLFWGPGRSLGSRLRRPRRFRLADYAYTQILPRIQADSL